MGPTCQHATSSPSLFALLSLPPPPLSLSLTSLRRLVDRWGGSRRGEAGEEEEVGGRRRAMRRRWWRQCWTRDRRSFSSACEAQDERPTVVTARRGTRCHGCTTAWWKTAARPAARPSGAAPFFFSFSSSSPILFVLSLQRSCQISTCSRRGDPGAGWSGCATYGIFRRRRAASAWPCKSRVAVTAWATRQRPCAMAAQRGA